MIQTQLNVKGEVHCTLNRGPHTFSLDALVVDKLDVQVLAGTSFLVQNDIATRPAKCQVIIAGKDTITYSDNQKKSVSCRRTESYLVRGPENKTVILPGDYVQLSVPGACDTNWAIEPRSDSIILDSFGNSWPSHQEVSSVCGTIRLVNDTVDPIAIKKHQHLCQIRPIVQV